MASQRTALVPAALLAAAAAAAPARSPNPNLPLDRPYTLRNAEPFLVEAELHRMAAGRGTRSHIFPRPCVSELDTARVCPEPSGVKVADTARSRALALSPVAELELRRQSDLAGALDFGIVAEGGSGPVSFRMDARMFTEIHSDTLHASYDREFIERQGEATGGSAHSSYSRFRSDLSYDVGWGRLTVARDAVHWGPGHFGNPTFNQEGVPFNQVVFTTHLGPLSVQSLYGQLSLGRDWETDTTGEIRSLYAHRYEWRMTQDLLFAMSEQLILHKKEAPFAFIPVVPLYIVKATEKEKLNNGNISGDLSWRFRSMGVAYAELMLDDIQSPATLFGDHWGNKWAFLAGIHLVRDRGSRLGGLVAEYARAEPWVYTHKLPRTSQTAHFDYPLGNPLGPNSQALYLKAYLRKRETWYLAARADLTWKGTDAGSSLLDLHADSDGTRKEFLRGVDSPDFCFRPYAWRRWGRLAAYAELALGDDAEGVLGASVRY